ncbi:MAG TPA: efflux RND transporter periplasmic adaptor subunit [Bryobacteraceae bacterium]|nr:efflux RND transporter periplasmic adaptor subunit [Bryobacteraceae bacterium]
MTVPRKGLLFVPAALLSLAMLGWAGLALSHKRPTVGGATVPTTVVRRGDVTVTVTARGELQGGNSEMLTAPMTGGGELAITSLREPGEVVQAGDVVVQFDTTEQEYKLREAEADLAEAEQQVLQAQAGSQAIEEEARYSLIQAKAELRQAQLEERRNPIVATIIARQNTLAVEAAQDRLRQIEHDVANRKANTEAGVAIQEAARDKAKVKAETARKNIESMTLRAHSNGYVSIQANTSGNIMFFGMQLPMLQVGDTVRPGMAVAQIPDLRNWEVTATIGELDRGHLAAGQKVTVRVVAVPGRVYTGKVKDIGSTSGPPWDRHFDCKIALDNPSPELRPGMSSNILITTEVLQGVLWLPSQALFESDSRKFVYLQSGSAFVPHDVSLVRRSESQVVVTGVNEKQVVALTAPDQQDRKKGRAGGAIQAISR